jgi:hypothetical protein
MSYILDPSVLSAVFAFAAVPFYFVSIWRDNHRPPYIAYLGWFIIASTAVWFQYNAVMKAGYGYGSLYLLIAFAIIPGLCLAFLFYLGSTGSLDKRDKCILGLIGVSWLVWLLTGNDSNYEWLAMGALIATDTFSTIPMVESAYKGNESKILTRISWSLTFISTIFGLMTVQGNLMSLVGIYPCYIFIMMGVIAGLALVRSQPKK